MEGVVGLRFRARNCFVSPTCIISCPETLSCLKMERIHDIYPEEPERRQRFLPLYSLRDCALHAKVDVTILARAYSGTDHRSDLCPHRSGIYDGLWHHRADQLCPR